MRYLIDNGDSSSEIASTLMRVTALDSITDWAETQLRELDHRKADRRMDDVRSLGFRVCNALDRVERELTMLANASEEMWKILGGCEVDDEEGTTNDKDILVLITCNYVRGGGCAITGRHVTPDTTVRELYAIGLEERRKVLEEGLPQDCPDVCLVNIDLDMKSCKEVMGDGTAGSDGCPETGADDRS